MPGEPPYPIAEALLQVWQPPTPDYDDFPVIVPVDLDQVIDDGDE